jgi:site-specific DNA-methyltransferase (adenine-specific)
MTDPVRLILGDCLEVMPTLEADSVDAVVTDPPYGLSFMGKHWDHGVPNTDFWQAMYRVAKPGAYLMAFGGTRTVHRIATNIEDAGWIIRDQLVWIYATGFPKGKANLKPAHEPIVLARKPGPLRPLAIDECRIAAEPYSYPNGPKGNVDPSSYNLGRIEEPVESHPAGRWPSNVLLSDPELFDEPNPYVVGSGAVTTGGLSDGGASSIFGTDMERREATWTTKDTGGYSRFFIVPKADRAERERGLADRPKQEQEAKYGSIQEFSSNPPRANVHPTVKPIDLMRHLVRLVTPIGGLVLDPFLGSGTTALAASEEGFRCIGIEKEAEYLEIAKGRLLTSAIGLGL